VKPLDPRLLQHSRSSRGFLLLSVLIAMGSAGFSIAQAHLLSSLITELFQRGRAIEELSSTLQILVVVFIGKAALGYVANFASSCFSTRIKSELRQGLINKVLGGESDALHRLGPAALSLLLSRGIDNLDGYFSKFIPQLFIASIVPLSVGVAITLQDWKSGVIIIFTAPLIPLFGILIGRFTASAVQKKMETLGLLSGYFLDLLSGLPTLKVYNRSRLQRKKLGEIGDRYRNETMKVLRVSFLSSLALELVATLSVALLAVSIGIRLVNGSITLTSGLVVLILAPEVYWPIRQVAAYFHAAEDGVTVSNHIFEILDAQSVNGSEIVPDIEAITWSELTVSYPNRSTVTIPAGQLVMGKIHALVGPSGSGKSTFIAILLGFKHLSTGEIIVSTSQGDFPFDRIEKNHWRSLLSWLPQDPHFASTTVGEIINWRHDLLTNVSLNISDLPHGMDTHIGALHDAISVGQMRKLALARACAKPSALLILDEPTASVDDLSEEEINRMLEREAKSGRIVLSASHRPSTIAAASNIIRMAAR